MATYDLSPHADRVISALGQSVTITNRSEDGTTDNYGDPGINESTVNVSNAIVDLDPGPTPDLQRKVSGFQHRYDIAIYIPKGNTVNEGDDSNRPSLVTVDDTGVEYIVEQKDIQNGMIRLGCRRESTQ